MPKSAPVKKNASPLLILLRIRFTTPLQASEPFVLVLDFHGFPLSSQQFQNASHATWRAHSLSVYRLLGRTDPPTCAPLSGKLNEGALPFAVRRLSNFSNRLFKSFRCL